MPIKGGLGSQIRRAFLFACYTGLRISDLKTLSWGRINRNPLCVIKNQQKTRRAVSVPLQETAWNIISGNQSDDPNERVFPHLNSGAQMNLYLLKWAKAAGVTKHIGWHTARRTFATLALKHGADIYTVARLLGHTGIKQVAKYAQVTDELRRKAVDALPCIDL
jgi:integrase